MYDIVILSRLIVQLVPLIGRHIGWLESNTDFQTLVAAIRIKTSEFPAFAKGRHFSRHHPIGASVIGAFETRLPFLAADTIDGILLHDGHIMVLSKRIVHGIETVQSQSTAVAAVGGHAPSHISLVALFAATPRRVLGDCVCPFLWQGEETEADFVPFDG